MKQPTLIRETVVCFLFLMKSQFIFFQVSYTAQILFSPIKNWCTTIDVSTLNATALEDTSLPMTTGRKPWTAVLSTVSIIPRILRCGAVVVQIVLPRLCVARLQGHKDSRGRREWERTPPTSKSHQTVKQGGADQIWTVILLLHCLYDIVCYQPAAILFALSKWTSQNQAPPNSQYVTHQPVSLLVWCRALHSGWKENTTALIFCFLWWCSTNFNCTA